ncbi:MAG: EAL domain-containing protein [Chromatiales bacterium]|jgi:diguanylate cyclase (GGDEF)-like protein
MELRAGRLRNLTVVVATAVVFGYVLLLLATTWLAQRQLRTAAWEQIELTQQKQAAALGYFYSERRHDLADLRKAPALGSYFVNRDLGMSMDYGLRASLLRMEEALEDLRAGRRIEGDPVYTDLAVYDESGTLLARVPRDGRAPERWRGEGGEDAIGISVVEGPSDTEVLMPTGVAYNDGYVGTLVAWVDHARAYRGLITSGRRSRTARFVVGHGQRILDVRTGPAPADGGPGGDAGAAPDPDETAGLKTPVPDTPFWLMGIYPATAGLGLLSSPGFFFALVALAVAVLGGAAYLLRVTAHNLMLSARVQESRRQEQVLSEQNVRLEREIGRRRSYEQRLVYQANFDQLTGLPNRALALDRLTQATQRARREGSHVLVVFADLDRFKRINDTLGHTAGDRLLGVVGRRLRETVRESDTVARLGGDEFLLICPDIRAPGSAQILAEHILRSFGTPFSLDEKELFISTSLGLALFPQDGDEPLTLMKNADLALYQAKDAGRHAFRFFTASMNEEMQQRLNIEGELRRAIDRDELTVVYQPIVSLDDGAIVGLEALLRWSSATLGTVPPDRFIPIAEESGFIEELGEWVLRRACEEAVDWQGQGPVRLAVNISSRQLRAHGPFLASVTRVIQDSGLDPRVLELEITESLLLYDYPEISKLMADLDRLGIRLALDDFGTGYSALSYLKRFPFRVLKIDRSFVQDAVDDPEDEALVRAILAMASALRLEVVGEGVETRQQAELLAAHQCTNAQGYYFSGPITAAEVAERLAGPAFRLSAQ